VTASERSSRTEIPAFTETLETAGAGGRPRSHIVGRALASAAGEHHAEKSSARCKRHPHTLSLPLRARPVVAPSGDIPEPWRRRAGAGRRRLPPASTYYNTDLAVPMIDRRRPGEGYRHLLRRQDVEDFIELLPDWEEPSVGLNAIVLAAGGDCMGWHEPGVVHLCAWERELWWLDANPAFVRDHQDILDGFGVEVEARNSARCVVKWREAQARAFQLLHVLLHELGHHHDRMTTRTRPRQAPRGEPFAEAYARNYEQQIRETYLSRLGQDVAR
jgi:hypothetical protein